MNLEKYLEKELVEHPDKLDLVEIMKDLAYIGKTISHHTNKAGLCGILGSACKENVQGEEVQKLDEFANDLCKSYLCKSGRFSAMASEEEEGVVKMCEDGQVGKYVIAFDPLDGSSNIDVNVSIGTIFSVYKKLENIEPNDEKQFLQSGKNQILAGYILYGSSTVLVFSFGSGVYEFTLDNESDEFLFSREKMVLPEECKYYSVNEGNTKYFKEKDQKFVEYLKDKGCSTRYIGSLVADFHRNLIKGGVFIYPAVDRQGKRNYSGKLRLNFEAKPMAFLIEQAGGLSTDGENDILDIAGEGLHERVALVIGNKNIIEDYLNNNY